MNLLDKNISYIIISAYNHELTESENLTQHSFLEDTLYLLDYSLTPINGEDKGLSEKSFLAFNLDRSNDSLRKDILYILSKYKQTSGIIKYKDDIIIKKINNDGSENLLSIVNWNGEANNKTYFLNSKAFSFQEQKRYFFVKDKKEIKEGMIIEYLNENKWTQKVVHDVNSEWDKMYKLLVKYNKLRYC